MKRLSPTCSRCSTCWNSASRKTAPSCSARVSVETDIRLFVTLVRFDAAYHGLFKCNLRRIKDYAALSDWLKTMLAVPGVRETVSMDHIKRGYYSIKALNPNGIVPLGPDLSELGL